MNSAKANDRRTMIHLLRSGQSPAEVAQTLNRSLPWVYKWRQRFFEREQWADLEDRSRTPQRYPSKLAEATRQAICQARSQLEREATEPGKLSYIGAAAIQARLRKMKVTPVPSQSTIERAIRAASLTRPYQKRSEVGPVYPHLQPPCPHTLIQVDIVTHFLRGGECIACFNAIDVSSHYPTGQQYPLRRSEEAALFMIHVWQILGLADYTQVDNEGCFSGGFTHPGVLGKVVRLALMVGTELIFSPLYHPESNGTVERFHQDYNHHIWEKLELADLAAVQAHSPGFFESYRQSEHISVLAGRSPAQLHFQQPIRCLSADFQLPKRLPLTAGKVHFIRLVNSARQISLLNLTWEVPTAQPGQGVWATLSLAPQGAKLQVYDAAPDATQRTCLVEHPFALKEPVLPLAEDFQKPIGVDLSWFGLVVNLAQTVLKFPLTWFSTMS